MIRYRTAGVSERIRATQHLQRDLVEVKDERRAEEGDEEDNEEGDDEDSFYG
jgi:hypothetical protein